MHKGVGNCLTLKLVPDLFLLFVQNVNILVRLAITFSAQKNRINPIFLMFLLGENSLLNSWYEFNPFAFHSQECWNHCSQEIQDAFLKG